MFRLNKLTDYAIVILSQMSHDIGAVNSAASLAVNAQVPLPTVAKILKLLSAAGVVTSHRGVAGGYSLDRPAAAVSVAEIIQSLEGPIALTACVDGAVDDCEAENHCPISGNWNRVNDAIRTALDGVSLADMTDPRELFPLPGQRQVAYNVVTVGGQDNGR